MSSRVLHLRHILALLPPGSTLGLFKAADLKDQAFDDVVT